MRQTKLTMTHCDGPNCSAQTTEHFTRYGGPHTEDTLIPEDWTLITPYDDTSNIKAFCSWACAAAYCGAKVVREREENTIIDHEAREHIKDLAKSIP